MDAGHGTRFYLIVSQDKVTQLLILWNWTPWWGQPASMAILFSQDAALLLQRVHLPSRGSHKNRNFFAKQEIK